MHDESYIKLSLHPTFLDNCSYVEKEDTLLFFTELRENFRRLRESLNIAKQGLDVVATDEDINSSMKVTFSQEDERELTRGAYRFVSMQGEVTLSALRGLFLNKGVQDQATQDFILQLLLQTRIKMNFIALGSLSSLPLQFSSLRTNYALFSLDFDSDQAPLELHFSRKSGNISLITRYNLMFSNMVCSNKTIRVGSVKLALLITPQLDVHIKELYTLIEPLALIREKHPSHELLPELKSSLQLLKNEFEMASKYSQSPMMIRLPETPPPAPLQLRATRQQKLDAWISANQWKTAAICTSALFFLFGTMLVATGIGSPLGTVFALVGIKLALSTTSLALITGVAFGLITGLAWSAAASLDKIRNRYLKRLNKTPLPVNHKAAELDTYNLLTSSINPRQHAIPKIIEDFMIYPSGIIRHKQIPLPTTTPKTAVVPAHSPAPFFPKVVSAKLRESVSFSNLPAVTENPSIKLF